MKEIFVSLLLWTIVCLRVEAQLGMMTFGAKCYGVSTFTAATKTFCCSGNSYPGNPKTQACCGKHLASKTGSLCCSNDVFPKGGPTMQCCDKTYIDTTTQVCCDGEPGFKMEGAKTLCCGKMAYSPVAFACCNQDIIPLADAKHNLACTPGNDADQVINNSPVTTAPAGGGGAAGGHGGQAGHGGRGGHGPWGHGGGHKPSPFIIPSPHHRNPFIHGPPRPPPPQQFPQFPPRQAHPPHQPPPQNQPPHQPPAQSQPPHRFQPTPQNQPPNRFQPPPQNQPPQQPPAQSQPPHRFQPTPQNQPPNRFQPPPPQHHQQPRFPFPHGPPPPPQSPPGPPQNRFAPSASAMDAIQRLKMLFSRFNQRG